MYCIKCEKDKPQSEFSKSKTRKSGHRVYCKACESADASAWRKLNRDKDKATKKNYYDKNRKSIMTAIRERAKARRKVDISFRILCNLRRRLHNAVIGHNKSRKTLELLGCNIEELKDHLTRLFTDGMSWSNYGQWHIDHIKPCSSFDMSDSKQQELCFNYKNLQPLWAKDNLRKSAKLSNSNVSE